MPAKQASRLKQRYKTKYIFKYQKTLGFES